MSAYEYTRMRDNWINSMLEENKNLRVNRYTIETVEIADDQRNGIYSWVVNVRPQRKAFYESMYRMQEYHNYETEYDDMLGMKRKTYKFYLDYKHEVHFILDYK